MLNDCKGKMRRTLSSLVVQSIVGHLVANNHRARVSFVRSSRTEMEQRGRSQRKVSNWRGSNDKSNGKIGRGDGEISRSVARIIYPCLNALAT